MELYALFFVIGLLVVLYLINLSRARRAKEALGHVIADLSRDLDALRVRNHELTVENESLVPFRDVQDAAAEAARLRAGAVGDVAAAQSEAQTIRAAAQAALDAALNESRSILAAAAAEASDVVRQARADADTWRRDARTGSVETKRKADEQAAAVIADANLRAAKLVSDAEARAQEIAGDAYRALTRAEHLEETVTAMRNVIQGYGDRYLKPTYGLLDQLADDYGFDEAGRALKRARTNSQSMVDSDRAATCDYVEPRRRETAIRFVLDAFNGKVDTVLARVKSDNVGTLEQQIQDAYSLVNHNGSAFRDARITPEYLASRLEELKWAASAIALKDRDREEQRRIREQIREEERARREIERALRDAAKEEDGLRKAMTKALAQAARANDEQRTAFEVQVAELERRLAEAEVKNQRALSMAQQTKAGHVYVISNVGSFGEHVFKVGMTRRLDPLDRVRELGDASVPFPFDIHAMIWAEDAPALENVLHKRFVADQVNKVNPRKEFFKISLESLRGVVEERGLQTTWTLAAAASQYRETLAIENELAGQTPAARAWLDSQLDLADDAFVPMAETED